MEGIGRNTLAGSVDCFHFGPDRHVEEGNRGQLEQVDVLIAPMLHRDFFKHNRGETLELSTIEVVREGERAGCLRLLDHRLDPPELRNPHSSPSAQTRRRARTSQTGLKLRHREAPRKLGQGNEAKPLGSRGPKTQITVEAEGLIPMLVEVQEAAIGLKPWHIVR